MGKMADPECKICGQHYERGRYRDHIRSFRHQRAKTLAPAALEKALQRQAEVVYLAGLVTRVRLGLYHVPSESLPGQIYTIWADPRGMLHCTCPGNRHVCKHIRAVEYRRWKESKGKIEKPEWLREPWVGKNPPPESRTRKQVDLI